MDALTNWSSNTYKSESCCFGSFQVNEDEKRAHLHMLNLIFASAVYLGKQLNQLSNHSVIPAEEQYLH